MDTITSTDGTTIAYEKTGSGPAIIVVSNVAEDHTSVEGLVTALAKDFTVLTFDRRGRGASGDPQPYDPAREIEDISALIDVLGGSAALTSGSGGCGIVLDAASALGEKVSGLYLYEPPSSSMAPGRRFPPTPSSTWKRSSRRASAARPASTS